MFSLATALHCLTALAILVAMMRSWKNSRDALAPMIVFGPMLLYVYFFVPMALQANDSWARYSKVAPYLDLVAIVNLLFVSAFAIGATSKNSWASAIPSTLWRPIEISHLLRKNMFVAGLILGIVGAIAFWYIVYVSGGPYRVFAKGKPFLSTKSGYIGELPTLVFPALILLALSWQGQPLRIARILISLLVASPHLAMGTLGGRRGPAFLVLVTLVVCYYLVRKKKPSLATVFFGLLTVGLVMFFLLTQRGNIYLGSSLDFDLTQTFDAVTAREIDDGHETLVAASGIAIASKTGRHYWGSRYFVTTFVRPIPRQWWPTKYSDCGMEWMESMPGSFGFDDITWYSEVGFVPFRGNAAGFVTDLFIEFSFAGCIVAYLVGLFYRKVWENSRVVGGAWTLVYIMMLALSVYLPSQSMQAWWVRLLFTVIPSLICWHIFIQRITKTNLRQSENK